MMKHSCMRLSILLISAVLLSTLLLSCAEPAVSHTTVSDASPTDTAVSAVTEPDTAMTTPDAPADTAVTDPPLSGQTGTVSDSTPVIPEGTRCFGYVSTVERRDERLSLLIRTIETPDIRLTDEERSDPDLWIAADQTTVYMMSDNPISPDAVSVGDIIAYIPNPDALIQETYPASLTDTVLYLEIVSRNNG